MRRAAELIEDNNEDEFDREMKKIYRMISQRDNKLLMYVQQVTEKANIVKGSKIYIPDAVNTKRIRKKLKMSQKDFAQHYRFNLRTLQQWEQGRRVPSPSQQVLLQAIDNEFKAIERVLNLGMVGAAA